jgi:predicted nucleic acid-binding protein
LITYADTSSIVKLYLEEEGSEEVRNQARTAVRFASSLLAYAEVRATLAAAVRQGRHTSEEHLIAVREFDTRWSNMTRVGIDDGLVLLAGDLVERHPLRGFDALHLASALTLERESSETVTFSAFDDRLLEAAAAEGLALFGASGTPKI